MTVAVIVAIGGVAVVAGVVVGLGSARGEVRHGVGAALTRHIRAGHGQGGRELQDQSRADRNRADGTWGERKD